MTSALRLIPFALALTLVSACAASASHDTSDLVLVPWHGPQPAQSDMNAGGVDVVFTPEVSYAVFVPEGRTLWLDVPRGERWFVWARGLSSGLSQVLMEAGTTSFQGNDVVLLSVAYIDGRADSPFFGGIVHAPDYPELAVGSQKLRAVWKRRDDAKENLVLEMNVR